MPKTNLHDSRKNKHDEFYTERSLIDSELRHYTHHFEGKTVYCNCDDPFESNFFMYFAMNFELLKLKKLIATSFSGSCVAGTQIALFEGDVNVLPAKAYKVEAEGLTGIHTVEDVKQYTLKHAKLLKGDGDFRSKECVELLKKADIVVTNPPFSLFRDYIALLMEYNKKFLIIGNQNAITYGEILPLFRDNKLWLGYRSGHFWFKVPDTYEIKATDFKIDENGQKWRRMGNICWFTNLDIEKRHENMELYKNYTANDYPIYDNFNAIEVSKTAEIPRDYSGYMGVPITFADKYNPDQFEFLGIDKDFTSDGGRFKLTENGKQRTLYARMVIKKRGY